MKRMMIAALAAAVLGLGVADLRAANAAKPAKEAKATRQAARTEKPLPLVAQVVKVEGTELTVHTRPMTGPDGWIAGKDKTYTTNDKTAVQVNGETKAVADLLPGEIVRLDLSEDGKTAEKVEARLVTPADKTARKAQRQEKMAAQTPAPEKAIP